MTRKSRKDKQATRERIIAEAARTLREHGADRTGVAEVMGAVGLTTGGFYRHFASREALLTAALPAAFEQFSVRVMQHLATADLADPPQAFESFYLSDMHVTDLADGCPLAALGSDVARASAALRSVFGAGLNNVITALSFGYADATQARRAQRATLHLATLVGAVVLARASDPATGEAVLAAVRLGERLRV